MPTTEQRRRARETVREYQRRYGQLTDEIVRRVEAIWDETGGLTEADEERFVASVVPVMQGGQLATARLVSGYLQTLSSLLTGERRTVAVPADVVTGPALRGIDPEVEWRRPIVEARTAIARENPFDEAIRRGRYRARDLAQADVMLAQRASTVAALDGDPRVVGYRRVLTGQSCVRCALASTQRYRTDQLMPIHQHCDCAVAPIYGDEDPGRVINRDLLLELKRSGAAGEDSLAAAVSRSRESVQLAERRIDEVREELRVETDPARRRRLEQRIRSWEERRDRYQRELARRQEALDEYRAKTGIVGRRVMVSEDGTITVGAPDRSFGSSTEGDDRDWRQRRPIMVGVREHGELGPVLVDPRDHFTGPDDL